MENMALTPEEEAKLRKEAETTQPPSFPPTWQPKNPGDYVFGVLSNVRTAMTKFGPRTVAEIKMKNGETVSVWISHQVLLRLWNDKEPRIGDIVYILYKGVAKTKDSRNKFHNYGLAVTRQESETTNAPPEVSKKPEEEKKNVNKSLPKIPDDQIASVKIFCDDILSWYKVISPEDLQKLLTLKGYKYDVNSIIEACKLKMTPDGKITAEQT